MKRFFLLILLFVLSVPSFAQLEPFKGGLEKAIVKAKRGDKCVLVMASATWCGPCKRMANVTFHEDSVVDFLNNKVVYVHYYLDKSDSDDIKGKYGVKSYPTFIVLNGEGEEVSRFIGSSDGETFLKKAYKAIDPEYSNQAYEKRYKEDINTGYDYANYLFSMEKNDLGEKIVKDMFTNLDNKARFSKKSIEFYDSYIKDVDNYIYKYMVDDANYDSIVSVMGLDNYNSFITRKFEDFCHTPIFSNMEGRNEKINYLLSVAKSSKVISNSDYIKFLLDNKEAILAKDVEVILPKVEAALEGASDNFTLRATHFTKFVTMNQLKIYKPVIVRIYEKALPVEKDAQKVEMYKKIISRFKI